MQTQMVWLFANTSAGFYANTSGRVVQTQVQGCMQTKMEGLCVKLSAQCTHKRQDCVHIQEGCAWCRFNTIHMVPDQ